MLMWVQIASAHTHTLGKALAAASDDDERKKRTLIEMEPEDWGTYARI